MSRHRIAIFWTAPEEHLLRAIAECKKRFTAPHITLVSQERLLAKGSEYPVDNIICSHREGRFDLLSLGWKKVRELNENRYDHLVLLYNNPIGDRCWNIDFLSFFIGGKKWIYDTEGTFYPIKSLRWICFILIRRSIGHMLWFSMLIIFLPLLVVLGIIKRLFHLEKISFENQKKFGG